MRFLPKRFLEEFFLYSSQFVVFFILMLSATPSISAMRPGELFVLIALLVVQISLLAKFGYKPLLRFLFSGIAPLGYTVMQTLTSRLFPIDMVNFFLWVTSIYIGFFQALSILTRRTWPKRFFETLIALGTVFTFVFFYFYLDVNVATNARYKAGEISYLGYLEALSIANVVPAFMVFIRSQQNTFFVFGALTFGIIQLGNKVKELSLQARLDRIFETIEPPRPSDALAETKPRAENRELTIVHADIWNFTSIAQKLDADETMEILSVYYGMWNHLAKRHGGFIEQYSGDTVVAVFGLLGEKDAAEKAAIFAREFLKELPHLQADLATRTLPPVKNVGIGIYTGSAAVGELGTGALKRLAIVGEAVNTAARIDSLCREFKQDLLVSHSTYKNLTMETQSAFERLGEVLLRGKTQPAPVYGLK
ncbi:MAG: adenylate/guanylate cyclase domain-containing protein [Spirochaetes bacterium]|nr:adenylate/guanylate cyclase domain-containing protein [Spirochaetota bacterium]